LQSGRCILKEKEREREGGGREGGREGGKEKETEMQGRERAALSRCDTIFTPIYGEIPRRGTLTTSKQDLWKTSGDLRYHYFPHDVHLPIGHCQRGELERLPARKDYL